MMPGKYMLRIEQSTTARTGNTEICRAGLAVYNLGKMQTSAAAQV